MSGSPEVPTQASNMKEKELEKFDTLAVEFDSNAPKIITPKMRQK